MSSSSTHQDENASPAMKTQNKSHTSKFIEGPMPDSPSQPPPTQFLTKIGSARSISESKNPDSQIVGVPPKQPSKCASEALESSSPKPSEKLPQK